MLDSLMRFICGVDKFTPESFKHIDFPEVVKFTPNETPFSNLFLLEDAFRILWNKKAIYSIEIWKEEDFEFYLSANRYEKLGELAYRFLAVYPDPKIEFSKKAFPEAKGYVASGFLKLEGNYLGLKTLDDFEHDPLIHVISAVRNPCMIQFLFKPDRTVAETFSGDYPLFRLRVGFRYFRKSGRRQETSAREF